MKSDGKKPHAIATLSHFKPPTGWPTKAVISEFIFKSAATDFAALSATSRSFHTLFSNRDFWVEVLSRDFKIKSERLKSVSDIELKKIYLRLAKLEETEPRYANWFRRNIVDTGCDLLSLYATKMDGNLQEYNQIHSEEESALTRSVEWEAKSADESKETDEDIIPFDTELAEALQTQNLRYIQLQIKKTSPLTMLEVVNEIAKHAPDNDFVGLRNYPKSIVNDILTGALAGIQQQPLSLEEARKQLYPIAAFSGEKALFIWLEEQFKLLHLRANPKAKKVFPDTTCRILLQNGKTDLIDWLLSPAGGDLAVKQKPFFTQSKMKDAIIANNPNVVMWFMDRAKIQCNTLQELTHYILGIVRQPKLTPLLKTMLALGQTNPALTIPKNILLKALNSAAQRGNVDAVLVLLDKMKNELALTAEERIELRTNVLASRSIPLLVALSEASLGANRMVIDGNLLEDAIGELAHERMQKEDDLPALIHWLVNKEQGNVPIEARHHALLDQLVPAVPLIKSLVVEIVDNVTPRLVPTAPQTKL
jgi:hypothetical protein